MPSNCYKNIAVLLSHILQEEENRQPLYCEKEHVALAEYKCRIIRDGDDLGQSQKSLFQVDIAA
jgi:hypothetical protein